MEDVEFVVVGADVGLVERGGVDGVALAVHFVEGGASEEWVYGDAALQN